MVLSGGSGTRLWPLSVDARPKQFVPLFGKESLFQHTMSRARRLPGSSEPIVVTGASHYDLVAEAAQEAEPTILVEPGPRNTGPAIVAAALVAAPNDVLVVMPSDHLIGDEGAFAEATKVAVSLAEEGGIVTFGCVPDRPEVGYGWIRPGSASGGGYHIAEFVEKPGPETAAEMLESGYLWNSGMFVAVASVVAAEAASLGLADPIRRAVESRDGGRLGDDFLDAPAVSFDEAVMEKTDRGMVVPLDAGWSDIGSWHAVWERSARDRDGNAVEGAVELVDVTGSLVRSSGRPVAVVGLDDVVVVETEDGVLVTRRDRSQDVREVGRRLQSGHPGP